MHDEKSTSVDTNNNNTTSQIDFYKNIANRDEIKAILARYEIEIEKDVEELEHFCEIMADIKEESSHVPNIATVIERMVYHVLNTTK
tara:strand:- start:745 stop:1005 length:261 start_codon:yes stop_codon:yes gene_type:complete